MGIVLSRLYLQLTYEALKHIEEEGPKLPIVRRVKTAEVFKVRWYSDLVLDIDGLEWPRLGEFSSWKYTKNLSIYIILAFFHLLFLFMLHYKYFLNIHHTMSCKIILYRYFMDAIYKSINIIIDDFSKKAKFCINKHLILLVIVYYNWLKIWNSILFSDFENNSPTSSS